MAYYVGLDVSQKSTSICVVDEKGKTVAEGTALSRAEDIHGWLGNRVEAVDVVNIGLEAGTLASWLYPEPSFSSPSLPGDLNREGLCRDRRDGDRGWLGDDGLR